MIDLNLLFNAIVIAVVVVNLVAIAATIRELATGSYKRYIEKRMLHLEQLRRVEEALKKGNSNG